jgi:seryl-tRNA synthetase
VLRVSAQTHFALAKLSEACRSQNYHNADGSITVPQALRPYLGGVDTLRA